MRKAITDTKRIKEKRNEFLEDRRFFFFFWQLPLLFKLCDSALGGEVSEVGLPPHGHERQTRWPQHAFDF